METMAKCPGVRRRKGSTHWWFRRRIPQDLLVHYHPKKEIAFSLETADYRTACEKARMEFVRLDQEFVEVRAKLNAEIRTEISDVEVERLAMMLEHSMLQADDEIRQEGLDDSTFDWLEHHHQERQAQLKRALARGDVSVVADAVEDWLINHGVSLDQSGESFKVLAYRFLKAAVVATEKQGRRFQGDVVETPPRPAGELFQAIPSASVHAADDGKLKLSGLFEKWAEEKRRTSSEGYLEDNRKSIGRFIELHGDMLVERITKAHVRDFKDAMLKVPVIIRLAHKYRTYTVPQLLELGEQQPELPRLSPKTVNDKHMSAIGAVLNWAAVNGYIENNPAAGIKVSMNKAAPKARLPYSINDLNMIFRFPVFTTGERPKAGGVEATKWLPLLALFTGARLQELGRLTTDDVKEERGIIFFDLTFAGTKTASAKRMVPLHPELIRLGFMEYVYGRRAEGGGVLFPDLKSGQSSPTENFTKWWGKYARRHGITDPRKVFHSFRHTVKDGFRNSGVSKEYRDLLQGHALQGAGEIYGEGASLEVLAKEMDKLCFPGLELGHLYGVGGGE
jgi:integrase